MAREDKFKLFISYSRDDLKFADQLDTALNITGYDCTIDRQGIQAGEDWKHRLGSLILEADTVIFVLSPTSAVSKVCAWEVEEAGRCGKRILPVLCQPLDGAQPPSRLSDLNFIYFYDEPKVPGTGFGSGLAQLVSAISTDLDWLREHTRLLQRAAEWEAAGRVDNRMLSGADIQSAKEWAAHRPKGAPEPTSLHLDYIRASEAAEAARQDSERQRLAAMAAAQEARAEALATAEAALKRAARARRIITGGSAFAAIMLAVLAGWAWFQRQEAIAQQGRAHELQKRAVGILGDAMNVFRKLTDQHSLGPKEYALVFPLYEAGADLGEGSSMNNLGIAYAEGHGIAQDFAKAREWYEKAAAKGSVAAMTNLGNLYANGAGVPKDYAKARELYEKAAAKGAPFAMINLGHMYRDGWSVPQDYAKAREWYEKAIAKGADVRDVLEVLMIRQAAAEGRYDDALRLVEARAAGVEDAEVKQGGKPGQQTARILQNIAWRALFVRDFAKALDASSRSMLLDPDGGVTSDVNRAHALMFLGRTEEARALYSKHKGERLGQGGDQLWDTIIVEDFAQLRKAGLEHPLMAEVETLLKEPMPARTDSAAKP
jgi:TPR repeat protein